MHGNNKKFILTKETKKLNKNDIYRDIYQNKSNMHNSKN